MGLDILDRNKARKFQNWEEFEIHELKKLSKDIVNINGVNSQTKKTLGKEMDEDDRGFSNKIMKELEKEHSDKVEDESIVASVQKTSKI